MHCEVSAALIEKLDLIIICLYRSPSVDFAIFSEKLNKILDCIDKFKNIIVCEECKFYINK